MLQLWEVLVPYALDNKPIIIQYHQVWDEKVRQIAGGLTILGKVKGQWISPAKELHAERMIPVRIACSREQIEQIAKLTAEHYRQHSVMFYKISDEVYIRSY